MKTTEAANFGRKKILKATGVLASAIFLFFLRMQTAGDFANGILFFIDALFNIHVLVILAILFTLTFVFGGMAGKEMIIGKKNFFWVSLKYAISIVLAIYIYIALVGIIKEGLPSNNLYKLLLDYLLKPLLQSGLLISVLLLVIWLWATNKMETAGSIHAE